MTRLSEDWVTAPETQDLCAMLTDAGHEAHFVGGCVRNALLGVPVSDIDITTDARPETVMELARAAGHHPVPTGIEHGTVTVVVRGHPFEVTTYRKDVETDGRRAVVAYAKGIEQDAHRRDFTMNALYALPDGTVRDPLGGLADLRARRVRFIDDAGARIREDYLRILRFFRFHAWYGDPAGGLDADALAAITRNSAGLETLSRERVGAEMLKLLAAPDPGPSVAAMEQAGVLAHVLPGAAARTLPVLLHIETEAGASAEPIRRLASLGGDGHAERLRLSRIQARHLRQIGEALDGSAGPGELAYRFGADIARDVLMIRAAMFEQHWAPEADAQIARGAAAVFPVRAADLAGEGLQGPALGARLKSLEQEWIASEFRLGRDALLKGQADGTHH